jgi:aminoglycoside phosphotransferase (APT) family kinase protein
VLDWEMCTLGDPLTDLGTALAYWVQADDPSDVRPARWGPTSLPGSLSRMQMLERYQITTGREVPNIVFFYVFALFKTAVIIQQIYYRYHHGFTKDERFASMGEVTKALLSVAMRAIDEQHI